MASLRPLDPSLATAARPRQGLVPLPSGGAGAGLLRRGAVVALPRRRGFSCRAGSVASATDSTKEKDRTDTSKLGSVLLQVCLEHQVKFGEHVGIIGSLKELGSWNKQVKLTWTPDGWVCQLQLPGQTRAEFKFVIISEGGKDKSWEDGNNRVIELPNHGTFDLVCHWNRTDEPLNILGTPNVESNGDAAVSRNTVPEEVGDVLVAEDHDLSPEANASTLGGQWQGSGTVFMSSNEHRSKASDMTWDTAGLDGIALKLVEGDKASRNWWRKLEVIRGLLSEPVNDQTRLEALIYSAIYLNVAQLNFTTLIFFPVLVLEIYFSFLTCKIVSLETRILV